MKSKVCSKDELKFIWVKKFKIISNLGVNFSHSDDHSFEYLNRTLLLKDKSENLLSFGSRIKSLTAIAGQNGSGKSSLCEIIVHALATLTHGAFSYYLEFVGIICLGEYIFHHKSVPVLGKRALKEKGYKILRYDESPLKAIFESYSEEIRHIGFVYYSNTLDWRYLYEDNLINLSTQSLLSKDIYFSPYFPYYKSDGEVTKKGYVELANAIQAHHAEESFRQIYFYLNFRNFLPFPSPDKLFIRIHFSGNSKWLDLSAKRYEDRLPFDNAERAILDNLHSPAFVDATNNDLAGANVNISKQAIYWMYKLNLIRALFHQENGNTSISSSEVNSFVFNRGKVPLAFHSKREKISDILGVFELLLENMQPPKNYRPSNLQHESETDWRFKIIEQSTFQNNEKNCSILLRLIDHEFEFLGKEYHSLVRLNDCGFYSTLSTGEYSFLSFFSRVYYAIRLSQSYHQEHKFIILFFDEVDVNFHPQWKKKLISWIVEFLNNDFGEYGFQLIMTSHSPYLLSDLATENIILFNKKNGQTRLVAKGFHSLGANIHELLSEGFFLEDGYIGEFAKNNIEDLILFLTSENNVDQWTKQRAQNFIDEIGDIIVKQRLIDLFNSKYVSNWSYKHD